MAVIKIFDSKGVKTVILMGNSTEQDYDLIEDKNTDVADVDTDGDE